MSSAPAKIILFGEHAVVYGQPAIAVPVVTLRAYAEIEAINTPFQIIARDLDNRVITFDGDNPLAQAVRLTLEKLNQPIPDIKLVVRSTIPIASGLGSGAAISTAIVRELVQYFKATLSLEEINDIVYDVEKIHHGTPSGIDNTVIVYEQAVYFVRDEPIKTIENRSPLQIIIADTGKVALTKHSVGDVRKLYDTDRQTIEPIIQKIGIIAQEAHKAMQAGDVHKLGNLMTQNHSLLQELTVSSPELDALVDTALENGALGAKLSGGGRGGNMIALVTAENCEKISQALSNAGAVHVYETTVEQS